MNIDKITPAVIISLIIGGIIGYAFSSFTRPTPNFESSTKTTDTVNLQPSTQPGSKEAKIQDAQSAAPESVANNATVMDFPEKEGGDLIELQKGTNNWTCFPDYPPSPGKDPMCVDKQGMLWMQAYITQQAPSLTQAGLAYMLQGGSDASNTDPFAQEPTEGDDWITTPSHTMIFPVGKLDQTIYSTDPKNGGPWIMWAGTLYEHLMVPVK